MDDMESHFLGLPMIDAFFGFRRPFEAKVGDWVVDVLY